MIVQYKVMYNSAVIIKCKQKWNKETVQFLYKFIF